MTSLNPTQVSSGSPRAMMDARISAAVSAGSISATDKTALSNALDTIDSALSSDRASGEKPTGCIKDRIDGLIDQQIKDGKLTDDQADELKAFFAEGPQGPGGPGDPSGEEGSSDGSFVINMMSDTQDAGSDASFVLKMIGGDQQDSSSTSSASATDDPKKAALDALMAFMEQLRSQSASTYSPDGSTSTGSGSGMIVDTKI